MVYKPREDSYLLQKQVLKRAMGKCLDVGTGTGIQAKAALKRCKSVVAVDIDERALKQSRKNLKNYNARCVRSDLFSYFEKHPQRFDTIIFNPPYLPEDARLKDLTLDGGRKGFEILERFFTKVSQFLTKTGQILVVFSSLTNKNKVNEIINHNLLEFKELAKQKIFFEELYVYKVTKSKLLKTLEAKGISDLRYFARGKRGVVYVGKLARKKVAIKAKRADSLAVGRIKNEANWLKILNKHKIGPNLMFSGTNYLAYEFAEGEYITDWLEKSKKSEIIKAIKSVFNQLYQLDKLSIDKEEMHRPVKHLIIKTKPVLIDFERIHKTKKPKNVTQFCQFLISGNINKILRKKGIKLSRKKMIELAKQYKKDYSNKAFACLIQCLG